MEHVSPGHLPDNIAERAAERQRRREERELERRRNNIFLDGTEASPHRTRDSPMHYYSSPDRATPVRARDEPPRRQAQPVGGWDRDVTVSPARSDYSRESAGARRPLAFGSSTPKQEGRVLTKPGSSVLEQLQTEMNAVTVHMEHLAVRKSEGKPIRANMAFGFEILEKSSVENDDLIDGFGSVRVVETDTGAYHSLSVGVEKELRIAVARNIFPGQEGRISQGNIDRLRSVRIVIADDTTGTSFELPVSSSTQSADGRALLARVDWAASLDDKLIERSRGANAAGVREGPVAFNVTLVAVTDLTEMSAPLCLTSELTLQYEQTAGKVFTPAIVRVIDNMYMELMCLPWAYVVPYKVYVCTTADPHTHLYRVAGLRQREYRGPESL